jgi:hypothetical protein
MQLLRFQPQTAGDYVEAVRYEATISEWIAYASNHEFMMFMTLDSFLVSESSRIELVVEK